MLLKILGSVMIIATSSYIGYYFSNECSKRPNEIRELRLLLKILENEMAFLSNVLVDAFHKTGKNSKTNVAKFFKIAENKLKSDQSLEATKAWEIAVREHISYTSLDKEDEEILVSFGKLLGKSDIEGQVKNIQLTLNQLKIQEAKSEEKKKKLSPLYRNLGMLLGLFLVIITI